jgi:hypothetical protein
MKAAEILFAADLSRMLEISEDEIFELARTKQLPFGISSTQPRRLGARSPSLEECRARIGS